MKRLHKQISVLVLLAFMACALMLAVAFDIFVVRDDTEVYDPAPPPLAAEPGEDASEPEVTPWVLLAGATIGAAAVVPIAIAADRLSRKSSE